MGRFFSSILKPKSLIVRAVLGIFLCCLAAQIAISDQIEIGTREKATPALPTCKAENLLLYKSNPPSVTEITCEVHRTTLTEVVAARAYLIETARPGYTMVRQGPELSIARLHPAFVVPLANAIREARQAGLTSAGIFSAYRPPAFGIGGFVDRFNSLHTYGLAVDLHGIGRPGTPDAQLWHYISAKHGVLCPYGVHSTAEWNHCQPTRIKIIPAENPLRETVTATGPISLEGMFEAGNAMITDAAMGPVSTADPSAQFFKMKQRAATTRLPLQPRTLLHAKSANRRVPQTGPFPFKGFAFKGPALKGQNVGAWLTQVNRQRLLTTKKSAGVEAGRRSI
jgi:hypothetical protein